MDWAVWVALGLPCLVLPLYLPLVQAVRAAYQEHFFSRPELIDAYGFYLVLLAPAAVPLGLALPAAGIAARGFDPADAGDAAARGSLFRPHELAAVLALALIPLAYVGLAFWTTGAFVYRYPLAALTGVTLVSVDVLHNWLGPRRKAVWTACAVLGGFFLLQRFAPAFENVLNGGNLRRLEIELAAIERSTAGGDPGPVVAATPQAFVQYAHYASPGLRRRLEYWSDPAIALERLQTDSAEYALRNLAPWAGLAVKPYEQARNTVSALYLVEIPGHKYDWITADLEARFGKGEKLLENGTTRLVRLRAR